MWFLFGSKSLKMTSCQSLNNNNHQTADGTLRKHFDIRCDEESTSNDKKITDLIDDCLELILKYLDLEDLVNVAKTNERMFGMACNVFSRNFVSSEQTLNKIPRSPNESRLGKDALHIFGHLMTNIRVWPINKNLLNYCYQKESENLIPFPNLKILSFEVGTLNENISQFRRWFPQLESLTMRYVNVMDPKCIEVVMPRLRSLSISNNVSSTGMHNVCKYFSNDNVKMALLLNPQLQHLSLCHEYENKGIQLNINLLKFINETLTELESFEMKIFSEESFCNEPLHKRVYFEYLKMATIHVFKADVLERFPIRFGQLKKLVLIFNCGIPNDSLVIVSRNKHLDELELKAGSIRSYEMSQMTFFNLIRQTNCLKQASIEISFREFLNGDTAKNLKECCSLTNLHLRCWRNPQDSEYQIDDFHSKLNDFHKTDINHIWSWTINCQYDKKHIMSHFTYPVQINESGEDDRELCQVDIFFERKFEMLSMEF